MLVDFSPDMKGRDFMNRTRRRLFSILLCICMTLSMMSGTTAYAQGMDGQTAASGETEPNQTAPAVEQTVSDGTAGAPEETGGTDVPASTEETLTNSENGETTVPEETAATGETNPGEASVPTGETSPSEETAPTGETSPSEETAPTGETTPSEATDPTGETTPSEVTDPTGETSPSEATDPTGETTPSEATDPTGETSPSEATDPTGEASPSEETDPTGETDPSEVTDPTGETTPSEETDPTEESTEPTDSEPVTYPWDEMTDEEFADFMITEGYPPYEEDADALASLSARVERVEDEQMRLFLGVILEAFMNHEEFHPMDLLAVPYAASAGSITLAELNGPGMFFKQAERGTCTLTANAMMVRRAARLNGNPNWTYVTERSLRSVAWVEDIGMGWNYSFAGITVAHTNVSSSTMEQFLAFLRQHPEGFVAYNKNKPHAVLITDYDEKTGTIYCADPGLSDQRMPLEQSVLKTGDQSSTVKGFTAYWYVSSPKLTLAPTAPEEQTAELYGNSLTLNGDIGLNFYVFLPASLAADPNAYAILNDSRVPVSSATVSTVSGRTLYKFSCNVASPHMGVPIGFRLYDGSGRPVTLLKKGQNVTDSCYYSIADYCFAASGTSNSRLASLTRAMINYGHYSQLQFGTGVPVAAPAGFSMDAANLKALSAYAPQVTGSVPGLSYLGSSVVLESQTTIKHYFTLGEGSRASDYLVAVDGVPVQMEVNGKTCVVRVPDVTAPKLGIAYKIVVQRNGSAIEINNYSAFSYAYAAVSKNASAALINAARALYCYGMAAKNYFGV